MQTMREVFRENQLPMRKHRQFFCARKRLAPFGKCTADGLHLSRDGGGGAGLLRRRSLFFQCMKWIAAAMISASLVLSAVASRRRTVFFARRGPAGCPQSPSGYRRFRVPAGICRESFVQYEKFQNGTKRGW